MEIAPIDKTLENRIKKIGLFVGGLGVLGGMVTYAGFSGAFSKSVMRLTHRDLPVEVRKYDNNPRDGYLDAGELAKLVEENEIKKR